MMRSSNLALHFLAAYLGRVSLALIRNAIYGSALGTVNSRDRRPNVVYKVYDSNLQIRLQVAGS